MSGIQSTRARKCALRLCQPRGTSIGSRRVTAGSRRLTRYIPLSLTTVLFNLRRFFAKPPIGLVGLLDLGTLTRFFLGAIVRSRRYRRYRRCQGYKGYRGYRCQSYRSIRLRKVQQLKEKRRSSRRIISRVFCYGPYILFRSKQVSYLHTYKSIGERLYKCPF